MFKNQTLKFFVVDHRHDYLLYHDHDDHGWSENEPIQLEWNMIIVMDALGRGTHPLEVDGDDDQSVTGHNFFSDTGTGAYFCYQIFPIPVPVLIFGINIFWYHFRYHPKQWKIPGESSVPVPNSREFSGTGSKFLWLSNFTGTGLYLAMFESINMDK